MATRTIESFYDLRESFYDLRCSAILAAFGGPDEWNDVTACLLCPVTWLQEAWEYAECIQGEGGRFGEPHRNRLQAFGQAVRLMHEG
jgi:hypothetical protein